jgi:subtilisin-like proprotein convertase family protein
MASRKSKLLFSTLALLFVAIVGLAIGQSPGSAPGTASEQAQAFGRGPSTLSGYSAPSLVQTSDSGPLVSGSVKNDTSPPLLSMTPLRSSAGRGHNESEREINRDGLVNSPDSDPVVQRSFGPLAMPTPILNFDGQSNPAACGGCSPPDPSGDVGPNHYIQMVNVQFQIFNKSGVSVFGPADFNTLFQGFGGTCESSNDGDPVVLYDQIADRWMLTQFTQSPATECIAISATGNPTGSYHRYAFATPSNRFPDYPKFGVWPDGYYMTANEPTRMGIYAFDRAKMLLGQPATYIYFQNNSDTWAGLLPSDLDGTTLPPAGSPNYIIGHRDNQYFGAPNDVLKVFKFHADFATPANSTFTLAAELLPAPYDGIVCPNLTFSCIRQPGTSQRLDAIAEWTMHRMAYRNFGTHESIVFNHTVDVTGNDQGNAGIRWYELRGLGGTPVIHQQGTFAPDANARWMGSMAMDISGNIAVGFNAGGSALMPSIRYAGRLATDPLGELSQGEATLIAGGGVQTGSNRWGDYSQLGVDPTDDCTFWYTAEYYQTTSSSNWRTRIGSFKFPNCSQGTPTPTVTGTPPTNTPTRTPTNTATATNTAVIPVGCNATPIIIPDSGNPTPYPSNVNIVQGGNIVDVNVTLNNVSHSWPNDVDILLVGPGGQKVIIMSDAGSNLDISNVNLTFDDGAASTLPDNAQIVSGTYRPTNYDTIDSFPAPAPAPPYATALSVFNGTPANGTWSLYVVDDVSSVDGGNIGQWCLEVVTDGATPKPTNTASITPTRTPTAISTITVVSTITSIVTGTTVTTNTPPVASSTVTAGTTAVSTSTSAPPTVTACALQFSDVPATNTFYANIRCLACRAIVGGYADGTFRPNNNITRGQLSKIVSNSAGFTDPVPAQTFEDVPSTNTFYLYIGRMASRGIIGGYPCGGPGEPCGAGNLPYFRLNANATRGQISKIVSEAAGITDPPNGQTYEDVPSTSTFYVWIERLTGRGVMSGYPCGGPGEPCGPGNKPYFRPNANATRGQVSKIVGNTFFPGCVTP